MPRRRALPKNTEVIMRGEPVLVSGGGTIKALSAEFLFDLQKHWRDSREQVLDDVAKKYQAQYFAGMCLQSSRAGAKGTNVPIRQSVQTIRPLLHHGAAFA
jgi:hypothetical protein